MLADMKTNIIVPLYTKMLETINQLKIILSSNNLSIISLNFFNFKYRPVVLYSRLYSQELFRQVEGSTFLMILQNICRKTVWLFRGLHLTNYREDNLVAMYNSYCRRRHTGGVSSATIRIPSDRRISFRTIVLYQLQFVHMDYLNFFE